LALDANAGKPKAAKAKPTPKPSATPDPTQDPVVQRVLKELQELNPKITASDIVTTSQADLRNMYAKLYMKQGVNLLEAKSKAQTVTLPSK